MYLVKFPSIKKFTTAMTDLQFLINYVGKDENGVSIYDNTRPKPDVVFDGFVKLHGTNGGYCRDDSGIWAQSKDSVLGIETAKDNCGFRSHLLQNESLMMEFTDQIIKDHNVDLTTHVVSIYGEWAGRGVEGGKAGIRLFPKAFYIFAIGMKEKTGIEIDRQNHINGHMTDTGRTWFDHSKYRSEDLKFYNITDYPSFKVKVNTALPNNSIEEIHNFTMEVERDCPVSRWLMNNLSQEEIDFYPKENYDKLIGEGIVWSATYNGLTLRFKTKGADHAPSTRVRVMSTEKVEKSIKVKEIVEKVLPAWRLDQFLVSTFDLNNGGELSTKLLGKYISAIFEDIRKEDMDVITEAGLDMKDISSSVGITVRGYFFERLKKQTQEE